MNRPRAGGGPLLALLCDLALCLLATGALQAQVTYHVSRSGSNSNPGTADRPFQTIQRAVAAARSGDTVLVHAGVYAERVEVLSSGRPDQPITLRSAGDGEVVLAPPLSGASCAADGPTSDRALTIRDGRDHWVIRDLTIVGGIVVKGTNIGSNLHRHLENRGLPGRGMHDPAGARSTLVTLGSDGADGVQILDNRIRRRGIYTVAARYGAIEGNEISEIECGTGGGIWLGRFSDGWTIRRNHVHDLAGSALHYMSEGIRHSGASNYNLIEDNIVEDVAGLGRGISTDVNSSWNVIRGNQVRRADHGFSEQEGGWGNEWIGNVAEDSRTAGFTIYHVGADQALPSSRAPAFLRVRCNQSVPGAVALRIGAVRNSEFAGNDFPSVRLGRNLRGYWRSAGNVWEADSTPPPERPPPALRRVWGDVNLDRKIDEDDATSILSHASGIAVDGGEIGLGDVDADSRITSSDALAVLHFAHGLQDRETRAGAPLACE